MSEAITVYPEEWNSNSYDSDEFVLILRCGTSPRSRRYSLGGYYDPLDDLLADVHWPRLHWWTDELRGWGALVGPSYGEGWALPAEARCGALDRALWCLARHWSGCESCIYQRHCDLGDRLERVVDYARERVRG